MTLNPNKKTYRSTAGGDFQYDGTSPWLNQDPSLGLGSATAKHLATLFTTSQIHRVEQLIDRPYVLAARDYREIGLTA